MTSNYSCHTNKRKSSYASRRRYRNRAEMSTVCQQVLHEGFGRKAIRNPIREHAGDERCTVSALSREGICRWIWANNTERHACVVWDDAGKNGNGNEDIRRGQFSCHAVCDPQRVSGPIHLHGIAGFADDPHGCFGGTCPLPVRGVLFTGLQVLHAHILLVAPLGTDYIPHPGTDQYQGVVAIREGINHTGASSGNLLHSQSLLTNLSITIDSTFKPLTIGNKSHQCLTLLSFHSSFDIDTPHPDC